MQVTVGMPSLTETTLSGGKLTSVELRNVIHKAHGGDESMAMLSQELLVYLAMFIQTEPALFHGMLRLRIGLIIQVMATELGRRYIEENQLFIFLTVSDAISLNNGLWCNSPRINYPNISLTLEFSKV